MLGHEARLFPRPNNVPISHGNDLSMMNPMKVNTTGMRLDMNRNSLPLDRQFYENFGKYYQDQTMKAAYMRNNMRNHMNYMPYPALPFSGLYYRQLGGGGVDLTAGVPQNFATQQQQQPIQRNNIRAGANWQLDQVSEYCAELLNRDKHYWTDEETALMLELYEENRNYFNDTKTKKTKVWSVIANIINKKFNTNVNSEQCSQKYRNLKAEFLKVVDPNSADGGAKKFGRHFTQMKRLIEVEERKGSVVTYTSPQNASPASTKPCNENNPVTASYETTALDSNICLVSQPELGPNKMADTAPATGHDISNIIKGDVLNAATQVFPTSDDESMANILRTINNRNFGHSQQGLITSDSVISPSNSSATTTSPVSSTSSNLPADVAEDNANEPATKDTVNCEPVSMTYTDELHNIFQDYFHTRNQSMSNIEHDQKSNVICLKRCLDIFQKIVDDDSFV